MVLDVLGLVELRENLLREDLAELDTHLIVGVDAPNDTLREDLVLVERNKGTERGGGQKREDDAVARAVTLEDLRLDEGI